MVRVSWVDKVNLCMVGYNVGGITHEGLVLFFMKCNIDVLPD